jgi:hypothetical protein
MIMTDAEITLLLVVPIAFISLLLGSLIVRRRQTPLDLREIAGYRVLPLVMDESVESDRPVHISLGASGLGTSSTPTTLEAANILYYMARRMAFVQRVPLVTLSDPMTLTVAADALRKAYLSRDNLGSYRMNAVAWYPQGERSLAFAAGAAAFAVSADVTSQVLLGQFGTELTLLGEASLRYDQRLIANSTTLEGQAIAFAMSETPIVGEELFVGSAYLDRSSALYMGQLISLDVLRWLIILGILLAIGLNAVK